jgi:hypothetical protein
MFIRGNRTVCMYMGVGQDRKTAESGYLTTAKYFVDYPRDFEAKMALDW